MINLIHYHGNHAIKTNLVQTPCRFVVALFLWTPQETEGDVVRDLNAVAIPAKIK
jgi:hypothetical protein